MAQPKVVVVTRTKNRNLLLKRALDSVAKQTFKDLVQVIVNDGGDRESVEKLVSNYSHSLKVLHNPKSRGLIGALNQGITLVNTKYVSILDDDDSWSPQRLEKAIEYLEEHDCKAVAVKADVIIEKLDDDKVVEISRKLHPESGEGEISLYKQCYKNYFTNGLLTYERSVYEELGGYDESLETAEDWDFGIKLLLKYDVPLLRDEESLHFYHQRPNSVGDEGNSGIAGVDTQEKAINTIRNRYLRKDLAEGKMGVGYIMNSVVQSEQLVARLEGHINFTAKQVQEELRNRLMEDVEHQLQRLNPLARLRNRKAKRINGR